MNGLLGIKPYTICVLREPKYPNSRALGPYPKPQNHMRAVLEGPCMQTSPVLQATSQQVAKAAVKPEARPQTSPKKVAKAAERPEARLEVVPISARSIS